MTTTGTGTSVVTLSGTGLDRYDILVTISRAGTIGATPSGKFTLSLDGGITTSGDLNIPTGGNYVIPNTGLTLEFAAGTVVVGDTHEATCEEPVVAAADVVDAVNALRASTFSPSLIMVTSAYSRADATTIMDAVALFDGDNRFVGACLSAVDADPGDDQATWKSELTADWDGFVNSEVMVSAGFCACSSVIYGNRPWRPVMWPMVCRAAQVQVSRDIGAVKDGPLPPFANATALDDSAPDTDRFFHDESLSPGLDAENFATLLSFNGTDGYFVTNPNLMSTGTSDYRYLQHRRVMDKAAFLTNQFFTQQISLDVLLNPSTGKILEKEAKGLEQGNDAALSTLVDLQDVSALATSVSRDDDILNTETLTVTVSIVPKGYLKTINITMTFSPSI